MGIRNTFTDRIQRSPAKMRSEDKLCGIMLGDEVTKAVTEQGACVWGYVATAR